MGNFCFNHLQLGVALWVDEVLVVRGVPQGSAALPLEHVWAAAVEVKTPKHRSERVLGRWSGALSGALPAEKGGLIALVSAGFPREAGEEFSACPRS